jgi:hypothetical protein
MFKNQKMKSFINFMGLMEEKSELLNYIFISLSTLPSKNITN